MRPVNKHVGNGEEVLIKRDILEYLYIRCKSYRINDGWPGDDLDHEDEVKNVLCLDEEGYNEIIYRCNTGKY